MHYSLRDRDGLESLAVIGTERSLRHMVYMVCDEFLPLAGGLDTPAFKCRSRREVIDWLSTFIVRPRCSSSESPEHELAIMSDDDVTLNVKNTKCREGCLQEKVWIDTKNNTHCIVPTKDVMWVGAPWICHKRLCHYDSFERNGITISVNAFVYVMSEGREHHIAYIEDMYEDKKYKKKVRVRWFHKTDELRGPVPPPAPHAREVFITPFPQVLSVECVDGWATVLTPEHYEKCLSALPALAAQTHMCFRQFDNQGIKPFSISEIKGYWNQKALTMIESTALQNYSPICDFASDSMEMYDDEGTDIGSVIRRGPRAARSARRRMGMSDRSHGCLYGEDRSAFLHDISGLTCGNTADTGLGINISESKATLEGCVHPDQSLFEPDDKIELLCEDSGVRGCWFRCTVLKMGSCRAKVRYEELEAQDGCGKLEEWVSLAKVAVPDKLGMRVSGRLTMRPSPAECVAPRVCEMGVAVDAWWNDGWWEGFVTGREESGEVQVYFPGENENLLFRICQLRVSRDWVHGQWVEIKRKYDVEKFIVAKTSISHTGSLLCDMASVNNTEQGSPSSWDSGLNSSELSQLPVPPQLPNSVESMTEEKKVDSHVHNKDNGKETVKICGNAGLTCQAVMTNSHTDVLEDDGATLPSETKPKKRDREQMHILDRGNGDEAVQEPILSDELGWNSSRKRLHQADDMLSVQVQKPVAVEARDTATHLVMNCLHGSSEKNSEFLLPNTLEVLKKDRDEDDIDELLKTKRACQEHENMKSMHGPLITGSLFNSVPVASLVMSR